MSSPVLDRPTAAPTAARHDVGWGPLAVTLAGTFMTFLDFFIVNVALPSIQSDLHAGPAAVQLVVAGYGLTFAVGMISGGRLGDVYGRRRIFGIGLVLFTLTSTACGVAPNVPMLIAARVLQGGAAALMTPQVLAILGTTYHDGRRAKAFASYGLAMGMAGMVGQLLGGTLISANIAGSQWRGIFLINLPVGLIALLFLRIVPESHGHRARLDVTGTVLVTAGLVAIVLPLVEGRQYGWPAWAWLSFAAAPVLLCGFLAQQRRRRQVGRVPLIDLAMFTDRTFAVGTAIGLVFSLVPPSLFFVLALYLQEGRGFSPLFSGCLFAALGLGFLLALFGAERIAAVLGRQVLSVGAVVVAAGCVLIAMESSTASSTGLLPGLVVAGVGMGLVLVPVTALALAGIRPEQAGSASGVLTTAQQIGGALGVAIIGVVFFDALGTGGITHAFTVSAWVLAAFTIATAVLVQFLPKAAEAGNG